MAHEESFESFEFEQTQEVKPDTATAVDNNTPVPATPMKVSVPVNDSGRLVGRNLDEQWRLATAYCKSGMLPSNFNTPAKVLTGMSFAAELGLKPITALRQMAIINGAPAVYGDLPIAIVQASNKLEWIKESFFDEEENEICIENKNLSAEKCRATCEVKRMGQPSTTVRTFSVADATKAGLLPERNPNKPWAKYTSRMLQMRARSWALKDTFGDVLAGISIAEYDYNTTIEDVRKPVDLNHAGESTRASTEELAKEDAAIEINPGE